MKFLKYTSIILLLVIIGVSSTGCKKKIFSPLTLSGKVLDGNAGNSGVENCSVVLYKKKGSLLARNGITEIDKEICRTMSDSDGAFSMDLKWLDKRDNYYIKIFSNNSPIQIQSGNASFSSYKALENYVEFRVYR